jgi:hypothetical protein
MARSMALVQPGIATGAFQFDGEDFAGGQLIDLEDGFRVA